MKKLVLFFVLLFAIQLFAAPVDSVKYQHDPKPAFWLWKDIRGYFLYSDTTLYHKRFANAQFTGDLRLANNERIQNSVDGTISFEGNETSATLMTVNWQSSADNGTIADNDKIVHVLIKSWDEDSTAYNSWVVVEAVKSTTTGNTNFQNITITYYLLNLVAGDDISFKVANTTNPGTADPIISDMAVYIEKKPEA